MAGADVEYKLELIKTILREEIVLFCEHLDYKVIRTELIRYGVMPKNIRKRIDDMKIRHEQISQLILYLLEDAPHKIRLFMLILKEERNGYHFLYEKLDAKFKTLCPVDSSLETPILSKPGGSCRERNLHYRHSLKRFSHKNDRSNFDILSQNVIAKYKETPFNERRKTADIYCMVLDAEVEYHIIQSDKELVNNKVFVEILSTVPYTSNPTLHSMVYLARYSYALLLANRSYSEVIGHIEQACQLSTTIEQCRETGIAIYIYFNMLSKRYEENPTNKMKQKLLELAIEATSHFSRENEEIAGDFRRILMIKQAMVHLGIGIFGNNITNIPINEDDLKKSEMILNTVRMHMWDRMEVRWKMFFFISKCKHILLEQGLLIDALKYARKAKKFSLKGGFEEENKHIETTICHIQYLTESRSQDIREESSPCFFTVKHIILMLIVLFVFLLVILTMKDLVLIHCDILVYIHWINKTVY